MLVTKANAIVKHIFGFIHISCLLLFIIVFLLWNRMEILAEKRKLEIYNTFSLMKKEIEIFH